jgi:SAM-dependent methyltransferase
MGRDDVSRERVTPAHAYSFDNAGQQGPARMDALAALFDPWTIRHLEAREVAPGWHCLEVGGGGGSIATWLCDQVGTSGRVVVTDIDTRFLEMLDRPNLVVLRHDIGADDPPPGTYDLVHARLVLEHLPGREQALARLVSVLKPGGWLVLEDFDSASLLPDPAHYPGEELLKAQQAVWRVMEARGLDRRYGRRCPAQLRAHGLEDVEAEGLLSLWRGGSAGARLLRAAFEQLQGAMVGSGFITPAELARDLARIDDPDFVFPSPILWTMWGRRPATARRG